MFVRRLSAQEARRRFSDLLGIVHYGKEPVIVEKRGRDFVVVISPEEFERTRRQRDEQFKALDELWAKTPEDVNPKQVEKLVQKEIEAVRKERRGKTRPATS